MDELKKQLASYLPGGITYAALKCEVCGKLFVNDDEMLRIENQETKEVKLFHLHCLDRVGTA